MSSPASLIRRIASNGRPRGLRVWTGLALNYGEVLVFAAPIVALLLRLRGLETSAAFSTFFLILLGIAVAAVLSASVHQFARRADPRESARALDDEIGTKELFLTTVEVARENRSSAVLPLLFARAEAALRAHPQRKSASLRMPALRRDLILLGLTLLILLVPALPHGLLGAPSGGGDQPGLSGKGPGLEDAEDGRKEGDEAGPRAGIAGRLELRSRTDRPLYFLGEEIEFRVELGAREALSAADFEIVLLVDGEVEMALPLPADARLPTKPGEVLELSWPLKARLELIERYRRGILAIDSRVDLKGRDDAESSVLGNRVLIQVAENSEKIRSRRPTPVEKSPEKEKPKDQEKQPPEKDRDEEKRPNPNQEPKSKPRPKPGSGEGEEPPEELPSKDYVVEPLFSGDETEKRKVQVFDRDIEKASPEESGPAPRDPPSRRYEKTVEAEMKKLGLVGAERRAVRRYLEGLQTGTEKK